MNKLWSSARGRDWRNEEFYCTGLSCGGGRRSGKSSAFPIVMNK